MQFVWAIIAGLIIGLLAKLVIPGRQPIPLWLTVILGIIGGLVGNAISSGIGAATPAGLTGPGISYK